MQCFKVRELANNPLPLDATRRDANVALGIEKQTLLLIYNVCFGTKYVAVIHTLLGPPTLYHGSILCPLLYTSIIYAEENECDLRAQLRGSLYLKSSLYFVF